MSTLAPHCPAVVCWTDGELVLLDQTRLPAEEVFIETTTQAELEDAILRLAVRGAPAIGCAGAFGVVLAVRETSAALAPAAWLADFDARCERLARTRPTAVNLRWAVERCRAAVHALPLSASPFARMTAAETEALAILAEDRRMCADIGRHGAAWLAENTGGTGVPARPDRSLTLMTHCNAGALATGGCGTALAVMYAAAEAGFKLKVYADETRPLLQGARLTAWELARAGIDVTVICDNMAAAVMRTEKPDAVIVGADRIAANGDTANKIGTYGLAVLAKHHGIPFLVAAPSSTFDLSLREGAQIPIEERARQEIAYAGPRQMVPDNAKVFNPAFDVTPAALIAAWVTEKGVFQPPFERLL